MRSEDYIAGYKAGYMAGKKNIKKPRNFDHKIIDYIANYAWRMKYAPESLPKEVVK